MPLSEEPYDSDALSYGRVHLQKESFIIDRDQDISFNTGLPVIGNSQLPTFTCRSSFSSFLVTPPTPECEPVGFSFESGGGSNSLEIPSTVLSLPSFSFFCPGSAVDQGNSVLNLSADIPRVDSLHQGNLILVICSTSSAYFVTLEFKL